MKKMYNKSRKQGGKKYRKSVKKTMNRHIFIFIIQYCETQKKKSVTKRYDRKKKIGMVTFRLVF